MLITAIFSIISVVAATDKLYAKIEQRLNTVARANNVSDDKIIVRETHTFIHEKNLTRHSEDELEALRSAKPSQRQLKVKVVDLMRQAIYGTQDRMKELDPILQKHKNDPALRMNFIMNRLAQLLVDLKRIYTLSVKWRVRQRVYQQTIWYEHCTRKFFDILYTVEYAIGEHDHFMKKYGDALGAHGDHGGHGGHGGQGGHGEHGGQGGHGGHGGQGGHGGPGGQG